MTEVSCSLVEVYSNIPDRGIVLCLPINVLPIVPWWKAGEKGEVKIVFRLMHMMLNLWSGIMAKFCAF